MYETSPADGVFAFGLEALREPDISGFAAWRGDELLGIGAFKSFDTYGEVKSMRTAPEAAGLGVGTAILAEIERNAHERGLSALKLETGPPPHFLAANRFYEKHGFTVCGPFGSYAENAHSVFYEKAL
nr:GNAT family N-acetyltransferase [Altererythrobacter lutimaris]